MLVTMTWLRNPVLLLSASFLVAMIAVALVGIAGHL
jgi:hypothetical protein